MPIYMANGQFNAHRGGMNLLLDALSELLCTASPFTLSSLSIRLFQNDYTPVCQSSPDDFDEADFTGYGAVNVGAAGDCDGVFEFGLNEAGLPSLYVDQQVFTQSGTGTTNVIYGMYVTGVVTGETDPFVLASLRFENGPFAMDANGNIIKASGIMPLDCQMAPLP